MLLIKKRAKSEFNSLMHIFFRFIISAIFGGFISFIFLYVFLDLILMASAAKQWKFISIILIHAVWILPTIWGILGIFYFEKMLSLAQKSFERFIKIILWPFY
ncbi:MAG: hypothetical protein N3A72_04120 [bacterium]|nr:hypothetical protein [bacterium]